MNLNYQLTNDFADNTSIIWISMDVTDIPCLSDAMSKDGDQNLIELVQDYSQIFFHR
jgi:hypothetical protein